MKTEYAKITIADLEAGIARLARYDLHHIETDIKRDAVEFRDTDIPDIGITLSLTQAASGVFEPMKVKALT